MTKRWAIAAAAFLLLVFGASFAAGQAIRGRDDAPALPLLVRDATVVDGVRFVTAQQVLDAIQRDESTVPILIDVRTTQEFAAVHIAGALNLQGFQVPDAVEQLPEDRAWVFYCTCPDDRLARWATEAVERRGIPNAVVLNHGLQAWQEAAGSVVTSGDPNALQQGCGCSTKAEAIKLWALDHADGK